jgi:hypothetical protein
MEAAVANATLTPTEAARRLLARLDEGAPPSERRSSSKARHTRSA